MILSLAWRLARGARTRLVLLAACVAIGVAARAFVGSITAQAEIALAREARPLLGGDLEVSANAPITAETRSVLDAMLPPGWTATDTVSFVSMATAPQATRIAEIRAVGDGFPLLPPVPLAASLPGVTSLAEAIAVLDDQAGIAIEASALETLQVALGDTIRLGQRAFHIRAVLGDDPGLTGSPFSLGPRLVIHTQAVAETGLTGFGSRSRHALLIALADPLQAEACAQQLADHWKLDPTEFGFGARGSGETGLQVRTAQQAQFGLRRVFDRLGDFLRLATLGSLLIAAVGVWALVAHTVRVRADELAILATLGCPPRRSGRLLFLQTFTATALGAGIGAVLGAGLAWVALILLRQHFPLPITAGWAWSPLASGTAIGLIVAMLAALPPLTALRHLKPLAILRGEETALRSGREVWLPLGCGLIAIVLIAAWESRSWITGPLFIAALLVGACVARLLIGLGLQILARWRRGPAALRVGLANLARPGLRTATAVTALALAGALIAGPLIHRASIAAVFDGILAGGTPSVFVIDLMRGDLDAFRTLTTTRTGQEPIGLSPIVTARYRGRDGDTETTTDATREGQRDRHFRDREQRLSWRSAAGPDERIVAGRWAVPRPDGHGECTLDADFAKRLGADIGDVLRFETQGETILLHVVGLREVDFLGLKPNFFILVDDRILADFPQTWIAAIACDDPTSFIRAVSHEMPTATCIDVAALARRIQDIVSRVLQALGIVSLFAVVAGLIVLASLVAASARERRADAALLRVLGAGDRTLRLAAGAEFAAQGLLAAVVGLGIGTALAGIGLLRVELRCVLPFADLGRLAAAIACVTLVTGLIAVRGTWRSSPLTVLRDAES